MTDDVITSQPTSNKGTKNTVLDQPPAYEEVISTQPLPHPVGFAMETAGNGEYLASTDQENDDKIKAEPETASENAENVEDNERNRKHRRPDDCCFVCYVGDASDCFICRCFSNCCLCLADCTDSCGEDCADCLHNCCESNTQEQQNDIGCCGSCDAGDGNSGSNDNDCDCDCSCFD